MTIFARLRHAHRDLWLFTGASLALGMGASMFDSVFNNFLNSEFALTGFQRSFLELPRELPGFLVMFVSALFWFLGSRRMGVLAICLSAVGAALIGLFSTSYAVMVAWLFIYSMGSHLFMPVAATVGMGLAREGQAGRRLGQLNSVRNLAVIAGSFLVFLGFRYLNFSYQITFILSALAFLVGAGLMFNVQHDNEIPKQSYLKLHRAYGLYYVLTVLSGSRKQIFLTFAPWVLVTVFNQPTQILATLLTIGGIIGVLFQPILGRAIDRYGERPVLAAEAISLVFICFGYGFAKSFLPTQIAFLVVCACYLLDQMVFSVNMARSTYMRKIALQPDHIQPTLSAGVSIDHVFSISAALIGGIIWNRFGFQYVFLFGMVIAVLCLVAALQVRLPGEATAKPEPQATVETGL